MGRNADDGHSLNRNSGPLDFEEQRHPEKCANWKLALSIDRSIDRCRLQRGVKTFLAGGALSAANQPTDQPASQSSRRTTALRLRAVRSVKSRVTADCAGNSLAHRASNRPRPSTPCTPSSRRLVLSRSVYSTRMSTAWAGAGGHVRNRNPDRRWDYRISASSARSGATFLFPALGLTVFVNDI